MKTPASRTASIRCRISSSSGAYCALTSTSGIGGTPTQSRGAPDAPDCQSGNENDHGHDGDPRVLQPAVQAVVAPAQRPAPTGEPEAEGRAPDGRRRQEAAEPDAEHPGGDGDEGADHGRCEAERHRDRTEAVEPVLGPFEPSGSD